MVAADGRARARTDAPLKSTRRLSSRNGSKMGIRRRLRFESFLLGLAAAFAKASGDLVDREIRAWLRKLAKFVAVDRVTLWEFGRDGISMHCRFGYSTRGRKAPQPLGAGQAFPWLAKQYGQGRAVICRRIPEDLPSEAEAERLECARVGVRSVVGIPMRFQTGVWVIVFAYTRTMSWSRATIRRMRLVGEVFLSSFVRQATERSLRVSEARNQALLQALPDTVFVCDPRGTYLDYCCPGFRDAARSEALRGRRIDEVLPPDLAGVLQSAFDRVARTGENVDFEYSADHDGQLRHYEVRVSQRKDRCLVCIERDVTEQRRVQAEIEHLRSELTHVGRVNLTGFLTASLAHQLLQPITAIMGNAAAGRRIVRSKSPNLDALDEILRDVESSGESATEIIRGVQDLLRKRPRPFKPVDLNQIIHGVIDALRWDLKLRHVSLVTHFDAVRSEIVGDPTQLRQVVLNLVLNAMEAMTERDSADRKLIVSTLDRDREIELQVSDRGTGVDPANLDEMFKPFTTTKEQGTGMGLYICQEIVRSHRGRLSARNNADGPGLTVSCVLPIPGNGSRSPDDLAAEVLLRPRSGEFAR